LIIPVLIHATLFLGISFRMVLKIVSAYKLLQQNCCVPDLLYGNNVFELVKG